MVKKAPPDSPTTPPSSPETSAEILETRQKPAETAAIARKNLTIDLPAAAMREIRETPAPPASGEDQSVSKAMQPADGPAMAPAEPAAMAETAREAAEASTMPPPGMSHPTSPPMPRSAGSYLTPIAFGFVAGILGGLIAHPLATRWLTQPESGPSNTVLGSTLTALEKRLSGIESAQKSAGANPARPGDQPLDGRIAALEAALKSASAGQETALAPLRAEIAALREKVNAAQASAPAGTSGAPPAEFERLAARLSTLESSAKAIPEALESKTAALSSRLGEVTSSVANLGKNLQGIEAGAMLNRAAAGLASAGLLEQGLRNGEKLAIPLAGLRNLGFAEPMLAPLAPFAAEAAPSPASLLSALRAARKAVPPPENLAPKPPSEDLLARLKASARSLVEIRDVAEAASDSDEAKLGRAEAALQRADLEAAAKAISGLSPTHQAAFAPIKAKIDALIAAHQAVRDVTGEAAKRLATSSGALAR